MKLTAHATIMALTIMAFYPFTAQATIIDGINYTFDEKGKTAMVTSGAKSEFFPDGNVVIPESINSNGSDYKVVGIEASAFSLCRWITSVIIPNSIISIGDKAFEYCNGMYSMTLVIQSLPSDMPPSTAAPG